MKFPVFSTSRITEWSSSPSSSSMKTWTLWMIDRSEWIMSAVIMFYKYRISNTLASSGQNANGFMHFFHEREEFLLEHQAVETLFIANRHRDQVVPLLIKPQTCNKHHTTNCVSLVHLGILTSISMNRSASGRADSLPLNLTRFCTCIPRKWRQRNSIIF